MFLGTGTTSSSIHAAGSPAAGDSAAPNALVVLVKTKERTPCATAASSKATVPPTFVSTNWRFVCVATCGLCNVALWITRVTPDIASRTKASSAIEPTRSVKGDALISRPRASCPSARRRRISASPRWPALPVTRMVIGGVPLPDEVVGNDELLVIVVDVFFRLLRLAVLATVIEDDHVRRAGVDLVGGHTRDQLVAVTRTGNHQRAGGELRTKAVVDEDAGDLLAIGETIGAVTIALHLGRLDDLPHLGADLLRPGLGIALGGQRAVALGTLGLQLAGVDRVFGRRGGCLALALLGLGAGDLGRLVLLDQPGLEELFLQWIPHIERLLACEKTDSSAKDLVTSRYLPSLGDLPGGRPTCTPDLFPASLASASPSRRSWPSLPSPPTGCRRVPHGKPVARPSRCPRWHPNMASTRMRRHAGAAPSARATGSRWTWARSRRSVAYGFTGTAASPRPTRSRPRWTAGISPPYTA